jgi:hypothetical protein
VVVLEILMPDWELALRPDGSATIGYGSGDRWNVPRGTLDFAATFNVFSRDAKVQRDDEHRISILITRRSPLPQVRVYSRDRELVMRLLSTAIEAVHRGQRANTRLRELWERHPPLFHDR